MIGKRMTYTLVLLALTSILLGACQPVRPQAEASAPRLVKGEIYLPGVPDWGGISIALQFDLAEVDPATHEATGYVNWRVYQPQPPEGEPFWKVVDAEARNVFFGADMPGGDPNTAVVVAQIQSKTGWGQGVPGEYSYFWFRDGGNEGPDQWGMRYYTLDPWYEFFPADKSPAATGYFTVPEMQGDDPVLPLNVEAGGLTIHLQGAFHEVAPTGNPAQDIANIQAAIDHAKDGDTILLKAGTFNFGDWKTNPIPGGFVTITKGVTVKGDGLDAVGNPKTIIQGGGFRLKNHWDKGEFCVISFGGDGKGGVLDGVWMKEPHMYAVGIAGMFGQNHENITIRNVEVTDISHDIPGWDQSIAIGRPIDLGGNVPEWGNGGPLGTVTIEHCNISNMGTTVDLEYIDPETGTPYYRNPDGAPLSSVDSQGIGLYMSTATSFVVRDNTIAMQNEGIVTEGMGGTGSILISDNDITIETVTLSKHVRHGYRLDGWVAEWAPTPFARDVRVENNRIHLVGEPEEYMYTSGMILGADNGLPGYAGKIVVTNNEIDVQNADAAVAITEIQIDPLHQRVPYPLVNAQISDNLFSGTARYGVFSLNGAQHCTIANNDMSAFTPGVANVGLYGAGTYGNEVTGDAGTYVEADGAHDNTVTGYTPK